MGRRRKKRTNSWFTGICLILLLPVFITTLMQRMRLENLIYGKDGVQEVFTTADSEKNMEGEIRQHLENRKSLLAEQTETTDDGRKEEDDAVEIKILQIVAQEIG